MRFPIALKVGLLASLLGAATSVHAAPDSVIAINILLEPDATMVSHAQANNERLLKVYPEGFALDESHRPHITLVQRFVRTRDLDKIHAAAAPVIAAAHLSDMKLEAYKLDYSPIGDRGIAGISVRSTPELLELQQELITAIAPFTVKTGDIKAFTAPHEDPEDDKLMVGYVATFVPQLTGEHFKPHVSTGVAPKAYLDKMVAEPFEPFTFSPVAAAIYQLGPYGTAAKKLQGMALVP